MAASAYFDAVQKLYIAYYGRPADQQGRDFWAGKIDAAKGDIQAVVNAFGTSAEAQTIYGSVSVAAQVNNLFKNILGRDADIAGLNFYVGKVNSGEYSLASLAQRILDGASAGDDAKVVANKLAAANAFTAAIDTTAEVLAYSGTTAAQQARDYLAKVTADATTVPTADAAQTAVTGLSTSTGGTSTQSFALTSGVDNLVGTSGNDVFTARLADNGNTLNSGDLINGGAGADVLNVTLGSASNFAIAAETTGVETVSIRSQATNNDGSQADNNIAEQQKNTVDAQDMVGVTNWINTNSRADLIIEDVRILDKQITKDVTITMRDTDPGNVDYAVYFDQLSLRNVTSNTSQINLRVMDTYAASKGEAVLKDSPYGSFTYYASEAGGEFKKVTLASDEIQKAQTFAEMVTALQAAADKTLGKGAVTVTLGTQYIVPDSVTGTQVTGTEIILKSNTDTVFDTTRAGSGWLATDTVPATSGLYTKFGTDATKSTDLVTSTIVLDNVGRGSNGGDLIVGGLSVGDTSTSKGVQRFEITVEDDSKLGTIASTNNSLQEVTIKNGTTDRAQNAYNEYVKNAGLLDVSGRVAGNTLPDAAAAQNSGYGFDDVRLIDASAMTGKLSFTAQFSEKAVEKYLNLKDVLAPAGDNINVVYTGGAAADSMKVDIDAKATASNSNINVGREDFTFAFNGGAGDDVLDIAIDRDLSNLTGGNEVWYTNHRINDNVTINAGEGNDTVKTPGVGDFNINLGAGNDTAYTDNTGVVSYDIKNKVGTVTATNSNAVWVFNTADQAGAAGTADAAERDLGDLLSSARATVGSYGVKLAVNFRGLTKTVELSDKDYQLSDLEVNQAIKDAINGDVVLNKLLKAEDGPSGTLIVTSLTDGVRVENDLTVAAILPEVTTLNATVLAAYNAANKTTIADTATLLTTITNNVNGWFTLKSTAEGADTALSNVNTERFNSALAVDNGQVAIVGANGTAASDNKISGDAGNDVIVLSTTGNNVADAAFVDAASNATGANSQLAYSNETIKFAAGFGNDVIVNFKADTDADAGQFSAGYDILDFTALNGKVTGNGQINLTTLVSTDKSINVIARVDGGVVGTAEVGDNFSAAALKLTLDADATVDGTAANTASSHVFIVYDTNNVASVYTVVDGTADNDLVVTLQGTIDLADTQWSTLTLGNFA